MSCVIFLKINPWLIYSHARQDQSKREVEWDTQDESENYY